MVDETGLDGATSGCAAWLTRYSGKNVVRSYARWFGVDLGCSLVELQLPGVELDPGYVTGLRRTLDGQRRPPRAGRSEEEVPGESDEWFAYVAGHTPNGLPFVPEPSETRGDVST